MNFDREKFKNLVLYICSTAQPEKLGAVKLNKVLWRADFMAYYALGAPITGVRYLKQQHGPVPSGINFILAELERERRISVRTQPFHNLEKKEYTVLHGPVETNSFSEAEMRIINEAVMFVTEKHTAKSISELSHDRVWQAAADGEELPYFTVFSVPGQITEDELEWARTMLSESEHGGRE